MNTERRRGSGILTAWGGRASCLYPYSDWWSSNVEKTCFWFLFETCGFRVLGASCGGCLAQNEFHVCCHLLCMDIRLPWRPPLVRSWATPGPLLGRLRAATGPLLGRLTGVDFFWFCWCKKHHYFRCIIDIRLFIIMCKPQKTSIFPRENEGPANPGFCRCAFFLGNIDIFDVFIILTSCKFQFLSTV